VGATASIRRTSAVSSVGTTWAAFASDGTWDLVIPATAGDVLELGVSAAWNSGSAVYSYLDLGTIVSGSVVNWASTGTGSHTNGVFSWFVPNNNDYMDASGTVLYTVQSGDISGGNVTFRLYGKVSSSTRTLDMPGGAVLWAAECDNTPVSSSVTGTLSSSWAVLTGSVTVSASAGDVLACSMVAVLDPGLGNEGRFDAATMVSGSATNWFSTGTSSHNDGVSGWRCIQANYEPIGGSVLYTVQSGDVVSGQVTVRIWGIGVGAANRPLDAASKFYVRKV
jgi:hypothetical protein